MNKGLFNYFESDRIKFSYYNTKLRESCRGAQLREILNNLRLEEKLKSTEIAELIPLSHFNENYESLHLLATALSNTILSKK